MSEKNKNIIKDVASYALIIIAVFVIRIFIFDPVKVDGPSMDNTLTNGDIVIINKIGYKKGEIKRYDIVVAEYDHKRIIKRVIGLPNEVIEVKDNKVYADGKELDNSFASTKTDDFNMADDIGLVKIPGDSYLLMGDHRDVSYDSRYRDVGTFKKEKIVGKAVFRVWPLNKIGIVK